MKKWDRANLVPFEVLGEIRQLEVIASYRSILSLERLNKAYGTGRWRKMKGIATIRLEDGAVVDAEVHWYEAHGTGLRELKIKRLL